tara:strand:+ start:288 stop:752 length:465 start_codon:yes stop_codon:yes gene_type:complete
MKNTLYLKKISFISILLLSIFTSCNNQNLKNTTIEEIVIDIRPESFPYAIFKDSIYEKKVIVSNYFGSLYDSVDINNYFVKIYYNGKDSLISFWGGITEEMSFNKAKYYWTSDSSINMTLFNTNNKNEKLIFLTGSMDGKSGRHGIRSSSISEK